MKQRSKGFSALAWQIVVHEPASPLEQIRAPVRRLDHSRLDPSQGCLDNLETEQTVPETDLESAFSDLIADGEDLLRHRD